MKNFSQYFVFIFTLLPFFAFGGNVITVSSSGGDIGDEPDLLDLPGINISINAPEGALSDDYTLQFPTETPPLFLILKDEIHDILIDEILISNAIYKRTSQKPCAVYGKSFFLNPVGGYLDIICPDDENTTYYTTHVTFLIMEKVNGEYQEPQNDYNRAALGLGTKPIVNCVKYEKVSMHVEVPCSWISFNGDPIHNSSDSSNSNDIYSNARSQDNISQKQVSPMVSISPNPFSSRLEISPSLSQLNTNNQVKIVNLAGILMYEGILHDTNKLSLSTHNWRKGVYLVRINSDNNSETMKIVKF